MARLRNPFRARPLLRKQDHKRDASWLWTGGDAFAASAAPRNFYKTPTWDKLFHSQHRMAVRHITVSHQTPLVRMLQSLTSQIGRQGILYPFFRSVDCETVSSMAALLHSTHHLDKTDSGHSVPEAEGCCLEHTRAIHRRPCIRLSYLEVLGLFVCL